MTALQGLKTLDSIQENLSFRLAFTSGRIARFFIQGHLRKQFACHLITYKQLFC